MGIQAPPYLNSALFVLGSWFSTNSYTCRCSITRNLKFCSTSCSCWNVFGRSSSNTNRGLQKEILLLLRLENSIWRSRKTAAVPVVFWLRVGILAASIVQKKYCLHLNSSCCTRNCGKCCRKTCIWNCSCR